MGYFIRYNLSSLVILAYFLFDRITKNYFLINSTKIIDWGFIKFHLVKNHAGIFGLSLPGGNSTRFIVLLILFLLILYLLKFKKIKLTLIYGLIMMFAGGLSNMLDSFYHGFVVDFIDFGFWPVFNLSDIFISLGTIIILWRVLIWKEL